MAAFENKDKPEEGLAVSPYYRLITEGKNPRGIPGAKFIDNVEQFIQDESIEAALGALNELYSKYKYMEGSFEKTKNVYKGKIPELEQTLELLKIMKMKQDDDDEMITNYPLCDTIYAKAKVDVQADKVALYVGAKSFVEYSVGEALELMKTQIEQSVLKLQEIKDDLAFLRTSSITVEVNMARLFNHSVKEKKKREGK